MIGAGGGILKINDVEKLTGLTQKAIRLYETKGLVHIARAENGYRNYTDQDVKLLNIIKCLRRAGVSVTDIKLYVSKVINIDELLEKRKSQIMKESGKNAQQYQFCEGVAAQIAEENWQSTVTFTETEEIKEASHGALCVGIDIGTTTISAVVFDIDNKEQLEVYCVPHNSYVLSDVRCEQSVSVIMEKAEKLLLHIVMNYPGIVSIGLSGQMHGIVYINESGEPVSNLINWQDKRADQPLEDGTNTCERIKRITGEGISTGYGIATHYYNLQHGLVPQEAVSFCSIMDLFGMKVCGLSRPLVHTSVAASFGLFDVKNGCFQKDKLSLLGIEASFLPAVTGKSCTIGTCNGIPVSAALGDNQASFLGSVQENAQSILVNIGTGSQISTVGDFCTLSKEVELRPFVDGKYLICGSALCGGFAYAMLEAFFRSYAVSAGMEDVPQYKYMNALAEKACAEGDAGLDVDVSFCGKRWDPDCRGAIERIDRQNFTPAALVLGVLNGMCKELLELYHVFPEKKAHIVASGGAVRKNEVLRKRISEYFGMPVSVNTVEEEAATGAALFSAYCMGKIKYENGFCEYINYG